MIENPISIGLANAMGLDPDDFTEVEFHDVLSGVAELHFTVDGNDQVKPVVVYPED